ncbi:MAG: hypothetical protein ACRDT2_03880, partial [Natronosporangium sp.]
MTRDTTAVPTGPPAPQRWSFGDFPYGLEPLTLPPAGSPGAALPAVQLRGPYRDLGAALREGRAAVEPARAGVPVELFWFRWITGHQLSFIIWRLLGAAVRRATPTGVR